MSRSVVRLLGSHALASVAMSLPWPWLLVLVWEDTHSPTLLGLTAASRMLPYVVFSWWAARVGDHRRRDLVVRATVLARLLLLGGVAAASTVGLVAPAVLLASLAVAAATPAYPALAAAMPDAAGAASARATDLLVTIEVASFVVGPAIGGLLLASPTLTALIAPASVAGTAAALALLAGVRLAPPVRRTHEQEAGTRRALRRSAPIRRSLVLMCVINLVNAAAGVTLLLMARGAWTGTWDPDTAYGVASSALGFGALGAPAISRWGAGLGPRARIGVTVLGGGLAVVALSPDVRWALLPLLAAGAAAVHAESAATGIVQTEAYDEERASLFGLTDACMVAAALVGAVVAPPLSQSIGPALVLGALALVSLGSCRVLELPRDDGAADQTRPTTTVPPIASSDSTEAVSPASTTSRSVRSA